MKASALLLAVTALYSSGVMADHQEPLAASAYVCMKNQKIMGDDGCWKQNGVDRYSLGCNDSGDTHYRHSDCHSLCCVVSSNGGSQYISVWSHCNDKGGVLTSYNDLPEGKHYICPPVKTCVPDNTGAPCPV